MDPPVYDTLILSDVHLGADTSRAREATCVLKENRFRRLILLGDIFADLNFRRLTKEHWKFLGYIRKLSNPKRDLEVVWVEGNHDQGLADIMSHLVGVRVYQEYAWEYAGLRHLAIHGHQFDRLLANNLRLNYFGTLLYLQLQRLDLKGKPVARFIDRINTRWLRMSHKVASGALFHARLHKADRIFCGHTHACHAPGERRNPLLQLQADGSTKISPTSPLTQEERESTSIMSGLSPAKVVPAEKEPSPIRVPRTGRRIMRLPEDAEYENIGS